MSTIEPDEDTSTTPPPIPPEPDHERNPQPEDEAPALAARRTRTSAPRESKGKRSTRRAAARADTKPARAVRSRETASMTRAALERGLEQSIQGIAIAVTILDAEDGAIIARGEPRLTAALLATADQNPRFKQRLEEMLQGGTYMQLAVALGAIVLPITMRHVPLPPAFRQAAVLAQSAGEQAPDAPPAGWGDEDQIVHVPGTIYSDEHGAYTIDEAGNVVPFNGDPATQ